MGCLEQADGLPWCETEIIRGVLEAEVVPVNVDGARERQLCRAQRRDLGMKWLLNKDDIILGHVFERHFERSENHEQSRNTILQIRADRLLKSHDLDV